MLVPFLAWAADSGITTFAEVDVRATRAYRLHVAIRIGKRGRRLSPYTVLDSHCAVLTLMRWAEADGYDIDPRIFDLRRPKVPEPEPDVFHMDQLRAVLDACNRALPQEALAVGILVGSGLRLSELCGLAVKAPDGLADVAVDRLPDGAELRVRWDGGAKGQKSRRVPGLPEIAGDRVRGPQSRRRAMVRPSRTGTITASTRGSATM